MFVTRFTVRGSKQFPLYLLCAECAWPKEPVDATKIELMTKMPGSPHTIELMKCAGGKAMSRPNVEVWEAAGWEVDLVMETRRWGG